MITISTATGNRQLGSREIKVALRSMQKRLAEINQHNHRGMADDERSMLYQLVNEFQRQYQAALAQDREGTL